MGIMVDVLNEKVQHTKESRQSSREEAVVVGKKITGGSNLRTML